MTLAFFANPQYLVKKQKINTRYGNLLLTRCNLYVILTTHLHERNGILKMANNKSVKIRGFMKMTLLDFPGRVACTVFTGGCNLRCPFCHNADLVKAIGGEDMYDEVMTYLDRRKGIIDGVCISGGEPLLQPHIKDFICEIKSMGYAVKLDTNGSLPEKLKEILNCGIVDYVAMDVKSSPGGYPDATCSEYPFETFAQSMEILRRSGVDYEFRTTAVKGIHTMEDFDDLAQVIKPGEKYFIQRFADSGNLIDQSKPMQAFTPEETQCILQKFTSKNIKASLRG